MDIAKQLNVSLKTEYNLWKLYNDTDTTSSKKILDRPQNIQTGKLLKDIHK